jgi:hypothetical protein
LQLLGEIPIDPSGSHYRDAKVIRRYSDSPLSLIQFDIADIYQRCPYVPNLLDYFDRRTGAITGK